MKIKLRHVHVNIEIKVVSEGIYISERRDSYCKFVGDDIVEVPSDESEFFCPVLSAKKFITTNKIASFIDANRGKHNKTSNSA